MTYAHTMYHLDSLPHRAQPRRLLCAAALTVATLVSSVTGAAPQEVSDSLQTAPENVREYAQHALFLAHPSLEGRLPGTPGIDAAEQAIVSSLYESGFKPAFETGFRQTFEFKQGGAFGSRSNAEIVRGVNVAGILPGAGALKDQWVIIGAHHDHIGRGGFGSRSATSAGLIHEGADDNASGTAAVMLSARLLSERFSPTEEAGTEPEPRRSIMLATFSGEESGLNGSKYFVDHSPVPLEQISLMINLDMVGRLVEDRIQVCGSQSAEELPAIIEAAAVGNPLEPVLSSGLTSRSDHASFYRKNIPVLFLTETVFPDEYHTIDDEAWKLNMEGGAAAAELASALAAEAALAPQKPQWKEVEGFETGEGGPSISDIKIRFGIKPGNYGDTNPGVLVAGVSPETSAEDAGILEDDLLVGWNGQQIVGVREWMLLMAEHEPGDIVTVTVIRDDEEVDVPVMLKPR